MLKSQQEKLKSTRAFCQDTKLKQPIKFPVIAQNADSWIEFCLCFIGASCTCQVRTVVYYIH